MAKKVLITGIGGNVGQGIIRNIRSSFPDILIIGTNTAEFSAGNHLCDVFYTVPFAYSEGYTTRIQDICEKEKIDLVIPSTDYEAYYLSQNKHIGTAVAVSGSMATEVYLDKYLSYQHHQQHNIPFAASSLPSAYDGRFASCIAKPRKGRGSRGLIFNPQDWSSLPDEEYMIQELHKGAEITTAFYVNRSGQLHGFITLLRFLENGATSQCKVVFEHDKAILPILENIIRNTDIRGAANLQAIVTEDGSIQPFEINCRISGTNSIRSNFGFEDVKYTIEEYLLDRQPSQPDIRPGVAVRILMDVIYPNETDFGNCTTNQTPFHIF